MVRRSSFSLSTSSTQIPRREKKVKASDRRLGQGENVVTEGAVASQALAVRSTPCLALICLAMWLLLFYPGPLVFRVWRIIRQCIFRHNIVFFDRAVFVEHSTSKTGAASTCLGSGSTNSGILSRMDKGRWKTSPCQTRQGGWEGDAFRNGYQAVFVDFTKKRCWFILVLFAKMAALALFGVLLENSTFQFASFLAIFGVVLVLIVIFRPFANRAVDGIACSLFAVHILSVLLLMVAEMGSGNTSLGDDLTFAVLAIQLLAILGLLIPAYIDFIGALVGAIDSLLCHQCRRTDVRPEDRAVHQDNRRSFLQPFTTTWCAMLGDNLLACARYTAKGAHKPPYVDFEEDCPPHSRPGHQLERREESGRENFDSASSVNEHIYEPDQSPRRRPGLYTQPTPSDWEDTFIYSVRPRPAPGRGNQMSSVFNFENRRAETWERTISRPVIQRGGISFMFGPLQDDRPRPRSSLVPLRTRASLESNARPSMDSIAEAKSFQEVSENAAHDTFYRDRSGPMRSSAQLLENPEEESGENRLPRRIFFAPKPEHPSRTSVAVSDNSFSLESRGPSDWAIMQSNTHRTLGRESEKAALPPRDS